jgi:hypothetical protein
MKYLSLLFAIIFSTFATTSLAKRPKKPKQKPHMSEQIVYEDEYHEASESHVYNPNPAIIAGVGKIMDGALSIAQNPHHRPNIGHSVANIIHGIISIIVEKLAHKRSSLTAQDIEDVLEEICSQISEDITHVIITRLQQLHENQGS